MKQPGKRPAGSRLIELPADFEQALRANDAALAIFEKLPPSHQREYLGWIEEAKKQDTRRNRIQKTITTLLASQERQRP